jgi:DNA-binding transcriptional regulator YiaG
VQRYRQTLEEILAVLSEVQTSWMDEHSAAVIDAINAIPEKHSYSQDDIAAILDLHFEAGLTAIRLFLGLSKDEFSIALNTALG